VRGEGGGDCLQLIDGRVTGDVKMLERDAVLDQEG
jgi:hypothetical protein